ncbi:Concanavalin A-like lectin/glucanases superfamily protein [Amycolatopsis pretoriensis]|uniref:Concanavalin A-like lectin/glucanases superfamily protein n=1 Tax=Amycolatopsis pretoriensis TaxID=218821 RepID=A0A1H5R9X6_9PSEU|nr:LamG domain-containing protein [Amycolatopsis pretoriensis]SEF34391.1 Concanavalin A-like lectin/glucanases superfamily protein [Amycolatopsis pretoriensis]
MALVAAYSMDESGDTVIDLSGNAHDFALTSGATRVTGHTLGGLRPNGATPLTLPNIGQTDERTVMLWAKGSIPDAWPIQWYDPTADGGAGSGAWGILSNMGNICIQGRNGADEFARPLTAWPDTTNWHHVAGTFGGNAVKLYLDGVLADQQTLTGPLRIADAPTLFGWTGTDSYDDLRIYNTALEPAGIVAAMNTPVASSDLASAAALAIDATFVNRVCAAMQQYGVIVGKAILGAGSPSAADKARLILAQACLADHATYTDRFVWALASDAEVDNTVDDATIRSKVADVYNLIAGVPV